MRHRFTIAELNEMTDNEILQQLCRERQTNCTNIYSPLSKKLGQMIERLDTKIEEDDKAEVEDSNKHTEICCHNISYFFRDTDLDIDETGEEHIKEQICEGYVEGDLNIHDPKTEETYYGFWHIEKSE